MTKPGNSGSEEPKQAEQAPTPETADSAAETRPEDASEAPATAPDAPAQAHESPTRAPGGPPNSTLPEGTDNSGAEAAPAESAEVTPADAKDAEAEAADGEPAAAKAAEAKQAKAKRAEAKAAAAKASAAEDDEPLMVELEKAPLPPREETLRAKSRAPRNFDEPPPRTLKFSFYFFAASGLVWLVSAVIFLINKQVIIDAQVENNTRKDISADQIASAVNQLLWFYLILAAVFAVFLALFGWKATEGTRRARTLVTIFSAIMVIFHLLLFSTQFGILSALLAMIGLGLIWSRTARAYFPPKQPLS